MALLLGKTTFSLYEYMNSNGDSSLYSAPFEQEHDNKCTQLRQLAVYIAVGSFSDIGSVGEVVRDPMTLLITDLIETLSA